MLCYVMLHARTGLCVANSKQPCQVQMQWWTTQGHPDPHLQTFVRSELRQISLLTLSLLALLDSNLPGNSLWDWEFHPL